MGGNQFRHLEHIDDVLAGEDFLEGRIGINVALVLRVLKVLALDVDPQLLHYFRARHRSFSHYRREFRAHIERLHKSCIWHSFLDYY